MKFKCNSNLRFVSYFFEKLHNKYKFVTYMINMMFLFLLLQTEVNQDQIYLSVQVEL